MIFSIPIASTFLAHRVEEEKGSLNNKENSDPKWEAFYCQPGEENVIKTLDDKTISKEAIDWSTRTQIHPWFLEHFGVNGSRISGYCVQQIQNLMNDPRTANRISRYENLMQSMQEVGYEQKSPNKCLLYH